jgi:hypothetical protein
MKVVLFVEGHTEHQALPKFLKRWLDQRIRPPVGVQVVRFNGWSELDRDLASKARNFLSAPTSAGIAAVVMLLDLYGPDRAHFYPPDKVTAQERITWATAHFQKRVDDPRFRAFFAVHETEAWLLSQPKILPPAVATSLPGRARHPESVNFDEPPAKLLDKLYRRHLKRRYGKVLDGRHLFAVLDPALVYDKCPNFKKLLDAVVELTKRAARK